MVLIPCTSESPLARWEFVKNCVWGGPDWFTLKPRLSSFPQYQRLTSLFQQTLSVPNVGVPHLMDNLSFLKTEKTTTSDEMKAKVTLLYTQLFKEVSDFMTSDLARTIK
jgi:hypothetical protein